MMFIRRNPYRYHTPPGWNDMTTAPRDGTVIEVQNNWGIAPWYGLFKWTTTHTAHNQDGGLSTFEGKPHWGSVDRPGSSVDDTGAHLSWRAHAADEGRPYVDPAGGAQNTRAYWLRAGGFNPADYGAVDGMTFEEEATLERAGKKPVAVAEATAKGDGSADTGLLSLIVLACGLALLVAFTVAALR